MTLLKKLLTLAAIATLAACQNPDEPLTLRQDNDELASQPGDAVNAPESSKLKPTAQNDSGRVLLVINNASSESREIGAYYRAKRKIPKENVVIINVSTTENIAESEFNSGIKSPIQTAIKNAPNQIDFIVLTDGTPIRLNNNEGFSVDGYLVTMNLNIPPITELKSENIMRSRNPYFGSTERFSSAKTKMYLVTRLIGYTVDDAKKLVDNSLAASPSKGPFFFDQAGNRKGQSYGQLQDLMRRSHENLKAKGFESSLDTADEFQLPAQPLMGYITWGSNDGAFNESKYKAVKFLPGAICETFVSTSGRTFKPTQGGQSLIADLIKSGVTGVKGYVSEPYTFALAQPDVLFDRYIQGFNLAESFYAASPVVKWKDIVIGDPLCNPYSK
jgi:uncharacterized protein (TIGR03790 family)